MCARPKWQSYSTGRAYSTGLASEVATGLEPSVKERSGFELIEQGGPCYCPTCLNITN